MINDTNFTHILLLIDRQVSNFEIANHSLTDIKLYKAQIQKCDNRIYFLEISFMH